MAAGTSEIIAVCQSLQQVAEKCQRDPESCWYFHQTAIPCLLSLAVQASMPGNFLHLAALLLSCLLLLLNSTATLGVSRFVPAESSFIAFVHITSFHFKQKVPSQPMARTKIN